MKKPTTADLAWIGATVLFTRLAGLYSMNLYDDAFITFRHAINFAHGHGLVFNEGSAVLGTTSPLFALILAGAAYLGVAPPFAAAAIGITADLVAAMLGFTILMRDLGRSAGVAFALCFALDPHIIRVGVGGMEAGLFFLVTLIWAQFVTAGKKGPALVLSSLAVFIRPEGALLVLFSLVLSWYKQKSRRILMWTIAAAAIGAIGIGWIWCAYGAVLPQSIAAKSIDAGGSLAQVVRTFFFPEGAYGQWLLTILALAGVPLAFRESPTVKLHLTWTLAYIGAYLLARPSMWSWYGYPVYGAKALVAGIWLGSVWDRWVCLTQHRPPTGGGLLRSAADGSGTLAAKLAAAIATPCSASAISMTAAVSLAALGGPSPVRLGVYEPLATWCNDNVKPGQTIAAKDVGVIGYYSPAFIYDLDGLVWPERRRYAHPHDVIEAKKPDFLFVGVAASWSEPFDSSSALRKHYQPIKRFSRFRKTTITPSPSDLAHGWAQDYIIFQRMTDSLKDKDREFNLIAARSRCRR